MTDAEIERMADKVREAYAIKGNISHLSEALVEWEKRKDEAAAMGAYGSGGAFRGLSNSAMAEIKKVAQRDLQQQIDAAQKRLRDL